MDPCGTPYFIGSKEELKNVLTPSLQRIFTRKTLILAKFFCRKRTHRCLKFSQHVSVSTTTSGPKVGPWHRAPPACAYMVHPSFLIKKNLKSSHGRPPRPPPYCYATVYRYLFTAT